MITASHLPSNYNGLKICVTDGIPLSTEILKQIETELDKTFSDKELQGKVSSGDIRSGWNKFFKEKFDFSNSDFSIVVDPANMIGILEIDTLKQFEPEISVSSIYDEFDHTCPNHEANPIKPETLVDLGNEVVSSSANFGIAFDGDCDRVGFVDENGKHIPADIIGAIMSQYYLSTDTNQTIVYDLRSTHSIPDLVRDRGAKAIESPVGHTNVRKLMRDNDAVLGIELAGHFFFKETNYSEGGILPVLIILDHMRNTGLSLAELAQNVRTYYHSGEINSEILLEPEKIYSRLKEALDYSQLSDLDGLKLTGNDWWLNVRPSATEPLMRLNLEAHTEEGMTALRDEVLTIIRSED